MAAGDAARVVHVLGVAAERHGDEIHADLRGHADQRLVVLGQRAQRQPAALLVQALAVGQHAVVEHAGRDALAFDALDLELDDAVVEQQHIAGFQIVGQAEIADPHLALVAEGRVRAGDQVEAFALAQLDTVVGELLDPDLRPRQVGEDADLTPRARGRFPHRLGARRLRGRIAMGKIEAYHVHAGGKQRIEHAGWIGRGA